jgi:hypothetical protein
MCDISYIVLCYGTGATGQGADAAGAAGRGAALLTSLWYSYVFACHSV